MTRPLALALFLVTTLSLTKGQVSAPTASSSSIAGTVVKEPGSEPLKKVLVQVVAENQKQGGNYTTSTDADGHFRIENIVPGRYRIFFERTGYIGVNEHGGRSDTNVFTLQAGQFSTGLLFRMSPTAVISGRITDEDGEPMAQVSVIALRKAPGKAKKEAAETGSTNDLGEYRLAGLFPGQYWILAMPRPDFRDYEREKPQAGDNQGDAHSDTRYLTTYYPGTYDGAQASAVMLKAGDEVPINLTLVPARTYRVRGIVAGVTPAQKPVVELISKAGDSIHSNEVGPDGQFEVRGVGPGSYVLRASEESGIQILTARQEINVVAADVEGVKLVPQASFVISGHLHNEAGSWGDLTQYVVNLRATDLQENLGIFITQESFGVNATVDRQGNFEWKDVSAGNYILQLYGGGDDQGSFFLKSVKLGGRDVETGFTASGPLTLDAIVIRRGGRIEGVVLEKEKDVDNDHAVANATVVAVPEEKFRKLPDHFRTGSTDQHGRFTIRGLAPGTYTLYAWQDVEESVYHDLDFLKSQEANGKAVKLEENSAQTVELKLSVAGAEWQ